MGVAVIPLFTGFCEAEKLKCPNAYRKWIVYGFQKIKQEIGAVMCQEELKQKLINTVASGLSAKAISTHTHITYDILAKFKQGKLYLNPADAEKLEAYLGRVQIPTSI